MNNSRRTSSKLDIVLIITVELLAVFGIYCITNARFDPDKGTDLSLLGYMVSNNSSIMQTIFVALSPFILIVVAGIPIEKYRGRIGRLIYWGTLALLFMTLGLSTLINGTRNWLSLGGLRAFQPAEFAKIAVLLSVARQLSESPKPLSSFRDIVRLGITAGLPMLLVLAGGETGSVFVIAVMVIGMILFSGANTRLGFALIAAGTLGISAIIIYGVATNSSDYRILRLIAFTDPANYPEDGGYQILQAQKAIGSGQLTGLGTFRVGTITQLGYVPESSTDFILATIGEAFGFVGILAVLAVYAFLLVHIFNLGRYTEDKFGYLIINGVAFMLLTHVTVNILMCLGLFPITGIPLPFLSYGGSNLVTNMIGVGLILNVTRSRSTFSNLTAPLLAKKKKGARSSRRKKNPITRTFG